MACNRCKGRRRFTGGAPGGAGGGEVSFAGELTASDESSVGTITLETTEHGIEVGDSVKVTWTEGGGGERTNVVVSAVSGAEISFYCGEGTTLAAAGINPVITPVCVPYWNFCCGDPLSIASPDYVFDSCPNVWTFTPGDEFLTEWPSLVGSISLTQREGLAGVNEPYINERACPPNINTAGQIGGIECAQFTDSYMETPAFPVKWTQPYSIAMVIRWKGIAGSVQYNVTDGIDTTDRATIYKVGNAGAPNLAMFAGSNVISNNACVTNKIQRIVAVFNGTSSKLLVNSDSIVTGDAGSNDLAGFSIGQRATTLGGSGYWGGNMGECALWNKALSDSEMQAVEAF